MANKSTEIGGSLSVSRQLEVGADVRVGGSVTVGHTLRIDGWLDAPNTVGPLKGLFRTAEELRKSFPRPRPGWHALVGDDFPARLWMASGGEWTDTGHTADIPAPRLAGINAEIEALGNRLDGLSLRVVGEEEFDALAAEEALDPETLYFVTEGEG